MEIMGPYLILIVGYKSRLRLAHRIYFAEWTKGRMRCVSCIRNTVSQTDIHCLGRFGRFGTAPTFRKLPSYPRISSFWHENATLPWMFARKPKETMTQLSLYGQPAYSNCHLFIPAREFGFTPATERRSPATFPCAPFTRTGYHSEALPRMPFSASKSVYDDTGGDLDPNFADSLSASIIGRCEGTRGKLRGLPTPPLKLGPRSPPHGMRGLVSRLVNRISDTFMTPPVLHWSQ